MSPLRYAQLAHDRDLVATFNRNVTFVVGKLRDLNYALGFIADVHDHVLCRDLKDRASDDLFSLERGFGLGLFLLEGFQALAKSSIVGSSQTGELRSEERLRRSSPEDEALVSAALLGVRRLRKGARFSCLLDVEAWAAGADLGSLLGLWLLGSAGVLGLGGGERCGFLRKTCGCVFTLARFDNTQRALKRTAGLKSSGVIARLLGGFGQPSGRILGSELRLQWNTSNITTVAEQCQTCKFNISR